MKTKSFKKYLEKRLDKDEIIEIEEQALLEIKIGLLGKEQQDVFKSKR